jgi:hypothetical protein
MKGINVTRKRKKGVEYCIIQKPLIRNGSGSGSNPVGNALAEDRLFGQSGI